MSINQKKTTIHKSYLTYRPGKSPPFNANVVFRGWRQGRQPLIKPISNFKNITILWSQVCVVNTPTSTMISGAVSCESGKGWCPLRPNTVALQLENPIPTVWQCLTSQALLGVQLKQKVPKFHRTKDEKKITVTPNHQTKKRYVNVCQNLVPLVDIKIAGKWMFIPLKMVCVGIDPSPFQCVQLTNITTSSIRCAEARCFGWASLPPNLRATQRSGRGRTSAPSWCAFCRRCRSPRYRSTPEKKKLLAVAEPQLKNTCACRYMCMCIYIYVCIYIIIYICVYCIYIYTVYMYVYIYTHQKHSCWIIIAMSWGYLSSNFSEPRCLCHRPKRGSYLPGWNLGRESTGRLRDKVNPSFTGDLMVI